MDYPRAIEVLREHYPESVANQEAFDMAIHTLQREIPTAPIRRHKSLWDPFRCPRCDAELTELVREGDSEHSPALQRCECGQKLDWNAGQE